jgi:hypothetical protein
MEVQQHNKYILPQVEALGLVAASNEEDLRQILR